MVTILTEWVVPVLVGAGVFLFGHWRGRSDQRLALRREMPIIDLARRTLRKMPEGELAIITAQREGAQIVGRLLRYDVAFFEEDESTAEIIAAFEAGESSPAELLREIPNQAIGGQSSAD